MLKRLQIRNYGIIAEQEIIFSEGLNILTGETGAGKSIMLGALQLTLGQRADTSALFDKSKKAIIEAVHTDVTKDVEVLLRANDLDIYEELTMRREISATGKSRAFINDTPVTLEIMQAVSSEILDLHQQFESLAINSSNQQYALLDGFSQIAEKVKEYQGLYQDYQELLRHIRSTEEEILQNRREKDFIAFELDELEEKVPALEVFEEWESEFNFQDQAEDVIRIVATTLNTLRDSENSLVDITRARTNELSRYANSRKEIADIYERMMSLVVDAEDIAMSLDHVTADLDPDPAVKEELEKKISDVRKLLLKHNVRSVQELLDIADEYRGRLDGWESSELELDKARNMAARMEQDLHTRAGQLSEIRATRADILSERVTRQLVDLEMKNARFLVEVTPSEKLNSHGKDDIEFLFAANLGSELMPVAKVASGGELSRLNLCLKSTVSQSVELPTLVFDEIDAGVSGQVALKMGALLKTLSAEHQIIMITHSPQIAARADVHYLVSKHDIEDRSITRIQLLDSNARITEIAKMLSGDPPSEAAVLNAKQLIAN